MIQLSCDVVILTVLKQYSIRDLQLVKHLKPLKKLLGLSLLRAQDTNTYIRAVANSLFSHSYISCREGSDLANLTGEDIQIVKSLS